jgi:hypothetical protein
MGTRALTFVYDADNQPILNLYRQYDGYIENGHGSELAEFLAGKKLVNGFGKESNDIANGMGCLAASLVAHFKDTVGGFYIHSVTSTDCGQDYEYHVYEDKVIVKGYPATYSLFERGKMVNRFEGSWAEFAKFCKVEVAA